MEEPRPRGATFMIIASSRPGKYAVLRNQVIGYPPIVESCCSGFFTLGRHQRFFKHSTGQILIRVFIILYFNMTLSTTSNNNNSVRWKLYKKRTKEISCDRMYRHLSVRMRTRNREEKSEVSKSEVTVAREQESRWKLIIHEGELLFSYRNIVCHLNTIVVQIIMTKLEKSGSRCITTNDRLVSNKGGKRKLQKIITDSELGVVNNGFSPIKGNVTKFVLPGGRGPVPAVLQYRTNPWQERSKLHWPTVHQKSN